MSEIDVNRLHEEQISNLYEYAAGLDPSSEEYKKIHDCIIDISKVYNENSKIEQQYWTADENRKQELKIAEENRKHEEKVHKQDLIQHYIDTGVKVAGFVISTVVTVALTGEVIYSNVKWSPMQLKDGWNFATKMFKNIKLF